jgi:hypothetical protein
MKNILAAILIISPLLVFSQTTYTLKSSCDTDGECDWNDASSWLIGTDPDIPAVVAPNGSNPGDGDIIVIPAGTYVEVEGSPNNTEISDGRQITLKIYGTVDIQDNNARLKLLDGRSVIQVHSDGEILGGGNSARLQIGSTEIKGTEIQTLTFPNQFTEDNLDQGGCASTGDCDDDPLPIVLKGFSGKAVSAKVKLFWETISEENFDYFLIERSADGNSFEKVGTLSGHGNSTTLISYSFEDPQPLFGVSHYRLTAIDYDGSFEVFPLITVEYFPSDVILTLFPNPGSGTSIKAKVGLPTEATLLQLSVSDLSSRIIKSQSLTQGQNEIRFSPALQKGVYIVKVQIDNYFIARKIVID